MQHISSADARSQFSDILSQTHYLGKKYLVKRSKKPIAVILSVDEYKKLKTSKKNQ